MMRACVGARRHRASRSRSARAWSSPRTAAVTYAVGIVGLVLLAGVVVGIVVFVA